MAKKITVTRNYQDIPASRIHLDLDNPRHEPVTAEADAIAYLCNHEFVLELGKDISRRGAFNPLTPFGLMPMPGRPGHYISLEGNRRTCALIVVADPDRAPKKFRNQLRRIAEEQRMPNEVNAYVFTDKDEAWQWVEMRHLRAQGGIGTREWSAEQQARNVGTNHQSSARSNVLSVNVLDRLEQIGAIDHDERTRVPLTTLTRYLGTPGVRTILGIHGKLSDTGNLLYTHDIDEVDTALIRLVMDSITPDENNRCPVNSRTKSTERLNYARQLQSEGVAPNTLLNAHAEVAATSDTSRTRKKNGPRSINHPDTRKYLVPSGFAVTVHDDVLRILVGEGKKLKIEGFEFCANYLLRAIIERVMRIFAHQQGIWKEDMPNNSTKLTAACADQLKTLGMKDNEHKNIRKAASNNDTPWSLASLGHAVHGGSRPTASALRSAFHNWQPTLEAMQQHMTGTH